MIAERAIDDLQFLAGGGEMGGLMRSKEWRETSLGYPGLWPQSLRTTLSILLNSKFPMFLWWGPELLCFYNDAYRPSLGQEGKHPVILGMKAEIAWPEIWDIIKPLIEQVMAGGESTWSEDQLIPIYRNGKIEDVYWTFSYSPACDESGKPAGVFVTCSETTEKVITLQQLAESRDELAFAIEATELGTFDYNPFANKFSANHRLKEWFGLPAGEQIELQHALNAIIETDRQKVIAAIQETTQYSSGGMYNIEYSIVHPISKKETIVHAKGRAWFNEDKIAYRFNGTVEDITEKAKTHQKIASSEQRLAAAVAAVRGILWTNNATGEMEGEQPGWSALTGQSYEAYQGYGWSNALHPEDVQPTIDAWQAALLERREFVFEHRVKLKDGNWGIFSVRSIPLINEDGTIREWVGVHTDITSTKRAERALQANQEKLNIVIDASELGTFELDLKTDTVDCSPRFHQIFGYEKGEKLNHQEFLAHLYAGDVHIRNQSFEKALTTGHLDYESRIAWRDKSIHWIEIKGKIFYDGEHKPEMLIGTCRDTTAEKKYRQELESREQKFRLLADSMPQHVWTSDPEGNLNYFNRSVFDYSGLTPDQINRDGWLQIVHPDDRQENIHQWSNAVRTGKGFLFEHRFLRHDGVYRWQLSRAIPQKDEHGKIQMWVGTSTDIQDQKTFANELEKQVQERTRELEQKNIDLEKMNVELQSFAYISSHDLQEPLRKIQTFASILMDKEYQNLSNDGRDHFRRMQNNAARMQTLIDDLLAYSRTNTAERKYERTSLRKIIEEVTTDLQEEITQKKATIEIGEMCKIDIIPFQFSQLMHNLIGNALKFSNKEVPPFIRINSELQPGSAFNIEKLVPAQRYCHITVSDNGIGFENQYREKIFGLFQRLNGRAEYNGTGIGLAIVKKIVENHNGIITASGELNKGAHFDIYIAVEN